MSRGCNERQPGLEVEACSRALSQARVYIEQIRSRVSASGLDMQTGTKGASLVAKRDYLVDAAKQIRLALDRDVNEDYEAAFNYYKNGVDLLLGGIQVESNKERREAVKRKVAQYLKRAEEIFNSHLQRTLGNGTAANEGYSSLRFRPVRILSSPVENLRMCKVVGVIDKVQLVEDPCTGETFILKSLPKSHVEHRGRQTILPQGVPYMVKLLRYYVSEDSIFLRLQHVKGGKLWSHLRKQLHPGMERGKEYPECSSPFRKTIKLKNSYTAPTMSFHFEQGGCWGHCEAGNQWEENHKALQTCSDLSPDSVFLSPKNGQSTTSNQSETWNEHTSQSSSQEGSVDHPVAGRGTHSTAPYCTVCVGPINDIREVAKRQGTRLTTAHPTSLTKNASHLSQREPTKENPPLTTEDQDLWSPESQTLVDSFCRLKARVPSLDLHCPNGGLARDGIPKVHSELRTSPGTNPRVGPHSQTSKMVVLRKTSCQAAPSDTNTNDGHRLHEAPQGNTDNGHRLHEAPQANANDGHRLHEVPLACTVTLLTQGLASSVLGQREADPKRAAQEWCATSEGTQRLLHARDFSVKEEQKGISGSQSGSFPPKSERGTSRTCDQQDLQPPASENGIGPGLGSPDASPDIEVDGWCFVSAPPLSAAEAGRATQVAWGLPEDQIRQWAAEILLALEGLHQQGVMCQDLNPRNVLLDDTGHIFLTYFAQWPEVEPQFCNQALEELYTAPEVRGITEVTEACDWWSFGALLYELLTGMPLSQNHPSGIYPHTRLHLPDTLSCAAASLLTELLQCDVDSRLGSGTDGISKIKSHPFFKNILWNQLV